MKAKIFIFMVCWSLLPLLHGQMEKVAVFEDFGQPAGIHIGNGYIYIDEKTTIFVYSLKDYKLVNKFGKEGEGPGEMMTSLSGALMLVAPYNDKVYISSLGKLSVFSKSGKFIKESKTNPFDSFYPFGEKYICRSTAPKEENSPVTVLALFLADENLAKGRLICKSDFEVIPKLKFDYPITPFSFGIDKDKIFVTAGSQGFAIDVFDQKGEKLYTIKKDFPGLKVPASYKDKLLGWLQKDPKLRQQFELIKSRITFKDYYPPIYSMKIDQGKIYVLTNRMKEEEQRECIVMDLKGKEIKRVYLPVPEKYGVDYEFLTAIADNYFYKLVENIDEDTWDLYRGEI